MSVGAWLQLGRFQIEHEVGQNAWHVRAAARYDRPWHEPLVAEGWATTAHRGRQDVANRPHGGGVPRGARASAEFGVAGFARDFYTLNEGWTFNVGLAVDLFLRGRRRFCGPGCAATFRSHNSAWSFGSDTKPTGSGFSATRCFRHPPAVQSGPSRAVGGRRAIDTAERSGAGEAARLIRELTNRLQSGKSGPVAGGRSGAPWRPGRRCLRCGAERRPRRGSGRGTVTFALG